MSVEDIFEQLGSKFQDLSSYDRVVKAKLKFPHLTNKQLAEDIVVCPASKLRKHLTKAKKQGDLPEANDENKHPTDDVQPLTTSEKDVVVIEKEDALKQAEKQTPSSLSSNSFTISNQYKMDAKDSNFADSAHGLSIGDKVLVCNDSGIESHAICEYFDIKNDKWKVRFQSDFHGSLLSVENIKVFESHSHKCVPRIVSESGSNGLVLSVERITEYDKNGNKLTKPFYEVVKRPARGNLPLLYPEKPTWTSDEAKKLLTGCGINISFMLDMFMRQREIDAKWKDLCYIGEVFDCNLLDSEKKKTRKSLKEWNRRLHKAGYEQVKIRPPRTESSQLNFTEFMEIYGFPTIDQSQRLKSLIGLSYDFLPQVCDYCDAHATCLPVCECGESYCGPACRLAEWKNHKDICEQALDNMVMVNMIDKLWLLTKGYKSDCEGRVINVKS